MSTNIVKDRCINCTLLYKCAKDNVRICVKPRKEIFSMKLEVVVEFENGFGMKIRTNLEGLKRWLSLFEQSVSPISRLEVVTLD